MICEKCKVNTESNYGSGRFCSSKCARSYATQNKRKSINERVSKTLTGRKMPLTDEQLLTKTSKFKKTWEEKNKKREENLVESNFDELPWGLKRKKILLEQNSKCSECGISEVWNNKPLKFDLDHISGDRNDNSRQNLRCICPNCHSQTPTYKTLNFTDKTKKISDDSFCMALLDSESIYKALLKLKLNPHGGNYNRARRLIKQYKLSVPYLLI
jgi:hypothetical protein